MRFIVAARGKESFNKTINVLSSRSNHVRLDSASITFHGVGGFTLRLIRDCDRNHVVIREEGVGSMGFGSP